MCTVFIINILLESIHQSAVVKPNLSSSQYID